MIPATQKVIKPRPYRIYRHKTGRCFWSVNYTRSKIPFLCSGIELQIFKYPPFERTLCIDTYRINCLSKNGFARHYCIPLEKENYNDIGTPLDFRQENDIRITTLPHTRSENRHRKHSIITLVFGLSDDVGTQRCDNVIQRSDQITTKT